jgi:hypothetical protein
MGKCTDDRGGSFQPAICASCRQRIRPRDFARHDRQGNPRIRFCVSLGHPTGKKQRSHSPPSENRVPHRYISPAKSRSSGSWRKSWIHIEFPSAVRNRVRCFTRARDSTWTKLVLRYVRPVAKSLDIDWYGSHGFRPGSASNLHELDADEEIVQRVLRHARSPVPKDATSRRSIRRWRQ